MDDDGRIRLLNGLAEYDVRRHDLPEPMSAERPRFPTMLLPKHEPPPGRFRFTSSVTEEFLDHFDSLQAMEDRLSFSLIYAPDGQFGTWLIEVFSRREIDESEKLALPDVVNLPSVVRRVVDARQIPWKTAAQLNIDDWQWLSFGPEIEGEPIPIADGGFFMPADAAVRWGAASYELAASRQDRLYLLADNTWIVSELIDGRVTWRRWDAPFAHEWLRSVWPGDYTLPAGFSWTELLVTPAGADDDHAVPDQPKQKSAKVAGKRRGRKGDPEANQIFKAWKSGCFKSYLLCGNALGIKARAGIDDSVEDRVKKAVDAHKKRERRASDK